MGIREINKMDYENGGNENGSNQNAANEMKSGRTGKRMIAVIIAAFVILVMVISVSIAVLLKNSGTSLGSIIDNAKSGALFAKIEQFEPGTMNGNVYVNDYLGIKVTIPSGYKIASEADRIKVTSADGEATKCDLYINDITSGTTVMILCENLGKQEGGMAYTESEYADKIKESEKNVGTNEWTFSDNAKTKLAGTEYTFFTAKCKVVLANVTVVQKNFVRKINNNLITISISGVDETKISEAEAFFEKNK